MINLIIIMRFQIFCIDLNHILYYVDGPKQSVGDPQVEKQRYSGKIQIVLKSNQPSFLHTIDFTVAAGRYMIIEITMSLIRITFTIE